MASHWMRRSLLAAACASAALLAACGSSTVDSAISPQRAVVFGDAVNDVGQKGSAYTVNVTDGSRFNWTTQFASYWSLPVTPASKGGSNYAQGNARISAKPDAAGDATTPTITEQINNFLAANKTFGAQDIVLINGGISDLIAGMAQVNAGQLTADAFRAQARQWGVDLATQVRRITEAGGTHVVLAGVYDLSRTPWAAAIGQQALLKDVSRAFNTGLQVSLTDLGNKVQYVDLEYYVNLYTDTPSSFSFDNATQAVCTSVDAGNGIGTGTGQINSALCTPSTVLAGANVDRYVFADNVYLTPSAHRQFGTYAVDKVRLRW